MAQHSPLKSDERVLFFPTCGWQGEGGSWTFPIHGWIYEPEENSVKRKLLLSSLCRSLSLSEDSCATDLFTSRALYFLADNERGKSVPIIVGDQVVVSSRSGSEGHFRAQVTIPQDKIDALRRPDDNGWVSFRAHTDSHDTRVFEGKLLLLGATGLSVISDIDDTIKDSAVANRRELLSNTFVRPFRSIGGMPELYQALATRGAAFHYLSASPWQLYVPLSEFLARESFPHGSYHLKEFRWKDSRFFDLFTSPEKLKTPIIESVLQTFPQRRFLLVGDSGEKDPEIYGEIARRFPQRDLRILIREVPGAPMDDARRAMVFASLPVDRWLVFTDAQVGTEGGRAALEQFALR